jgi:hypothetical protein
MSHEIDQPDRDLNEGAELHAIIGEDPWLEEFARSPYDPLNSARATGRLTGLAARHVYRKGWMRIVAFLLGLTLVGGMLAAIVSMITASYELRSLQLSGLAFAIPFGLVGIKLILNAVSK